MSFKITDYIEFTDNGRAICPSCAVSKGARHKKLNLALVPDTDGAYKCHAGCTSQMIRDALGVRTDRQIPSAIAKPATNVTVSPEQVRKAHSQLCNSDSTVAIAAINWLKARGITEAMAARYRLGLGRSKVGDRHLPAITIPIPANEEGTLYYQKKRIAPWIEESKLPIQYKPWSQYGIPARVFFTWLPAEAQSTWICEGEWDAILLGAAARQAELPIAIASFTCGAGTVPPQDQLDPLPGQCVIFYDRNDKPLKNGDRPGDVGAQKLAAALGERAAIGEVPMPPDCDVVGWDVSDALNVGFTIADFTRAAESAQAPQPTQGKKRNPLLDRMRWNDELIANAPDVIEWLVPDLLTQNELFLLAAGPRAGKSLMAMSLAKAVAEGGEFLGRPCTQGKVLYVCLEDSDTKIKEREQAQGWAEGLPVAWIQKFKLSELTDLRELVEEMDPRLIILDTLSRIKDGSISESSAEMSQVLEPLQELAKEMDCTILLVHHTGKVSVDNAGAIDIFDTIRGSSAIRAVCRGSLIIAASERNYRLLAENGWGKHDLAIVLDANTLEWKLLGKWEPIADGSQKDAVKEFLIQHGAATFEQIAESLSINKKVLSEVLRRMQKSENAAEKVVKSGHRRSYSYSMALSNTIQQLDKLLDSGNSHPDSDRVLYPTKNTFSLPPSKRDHLPKSDHAVTGDTLITFSPDSQELLLDKGGKTALNPSSEPVSTIQHLSNTHNLVSPETTTQQGFQASETLSNNLSNTCEPLKKVTVLSDATWFRKGSDPLPRRSQPRSLFKAESLNIDRLDTPMFEELIGESELLGYSEDGERARVRNLETNRVSIFATKSIVFLRGGSHANG